MKEPVPKRYAYFPPTVIFGHNLIQVYAGESGPSVTLTDLAGVLGVSLATVLAIIRKNRGVIELTGASDGKRIPPESGLPSPASRLCLSMDGVSLVILNIDHEKISDPLCRERIKVAKKWLVCQISNRIKEPGRKHQHRWDSGLSQEQARELKRHIARLDKMNRTL